MTTINDLPLEILRMILQELYDPIILGRDPSFYSAACVSRRWTDLAYDLSFFRFYKLRDDFNPTSTAPAIKTLTKLKALRNSEGLRQEVVKQRAEVEQRNKMTRYRRRSDGRGRRRVAMHDITQSTPMFLMDLADVIKRKAAANVNVIESIKVEEE